VSAILSRTAGRGRPAPPVRLLHLGLGNFFRAHQCWYTDRAPDAADWSYAAFSGRGGGDLAHRLTAQDGLYTLVTRAASGDTFEVISSLATAHNAQEQLTWLDYFRSADLGAVTLTVTEAGYLRGPDGGLDAGRPEVQADLATLRDDPTALVRTTPGRLVTGLAARRAADAGPLALVPCDNVPGNGAMADRVVLSGSFPAGRPAWQHAGATFTGDVTPYEHRKLWLLNGGHSLLAYAGSIRGHASVADAVADDTCQDWLQQWWQTASRHLKQPEAELAAYRRALLDRFANPRMHHQLAQIGADGSQKLPIRILPVLSAERSDGRMPTDATLVLAAWICCLRGLGAPVSDVQAEIVVPLAAGPLRDAVPGLLSTLDPSLGDDTDLVGVVVHQCEQLASGAAS
jgi:fructuronate reductase